MGADPERIHKLQKGDEQAWEELIREFSPQLLRYFRYHLAGRDENTAEDLAQETFTCALQAIGRFRQEFTLAQFLFGIGRNRLVDHLRRQGHREELRSPTPLEDSAAFGPGGYIGGMESERRSPMDSVVAFEDAGRKRQALAEVLRGLVQHMWERGDFEQLKVLEFLLLLGGRNKEAAHRFKVESERAVAGIKFRALSRLRDSLRAKDPSKTLFPGLWAPGAM
jgi:RNA polymerase sigma-70 factor (ECF subfamily)